MKNILKDGISIKKYETSLLSDKVDEKKWIVIVDNENDSNENAILLVVGHRDTDYPDSMLMERAEEIVRVFNKYRDTDDKLEKVKQLLTGTGLVNVSEAIRVLGLL